MATFHHGKIYLLDHGIKTDLKGEKFCYSGTERNRTCLHHAKKTNLQVKITFLMLDCQTTMKMFGASR